MWPRVRQDYFPAPHMVRKITMQGLMVISRTGTPHACFTPINAATHYFEESDQQ